MSQFLTAMAGLRLTCSCGALLNDSDNDHSRCNANQHQQLTDMIVDEDDRYQYANFRVTLRLAVS